MQEGSQGVLERSYVSSGDNSSSNNPRLKSMRSVIGGFQDYASSKGYARSSVGSKVSLFSRSNSIAQMLDKKTTM